MLPPSSPPPPSPPPPQRELTCASFGIQATLRCTSSVSSCEAQSAEPTPPLPVPPTLALPTPRTHAARPNAHTTGPSGSSAVSTRTRATIRCGEHVRAVVGGGCCSGQDRTCVPCRLGPSADRGGRRSQHPRFTPAVNWSGVDCHSERHVHNAFQCARYVLLRLASVPGGLPCFPPPSSV